MDILSAALFNLRLRFSRLDFFMNLYYICKQYRILFTRINAGCAVSLLLFSTLYAGDVYRITSATDLRKIKQKLLRNHAQALKEAQSLPQDKQEKAIIQAHRVLYAHMPEVTLDSDDTVCYRGNPFTYVKAHRASHSMLGRRFILDNGMKSWVYVGQLYIEMVRKERKNSLSPLGPAGTSVIDATHMNYYLQRHKRLITLNRQLSAIKESLAKKKTYAYEELEAYQRELKPLMQSLRSCQNELKASPGPNAHDSWALYEILKDFDGRRTGALYSALGIPCIRANDDTAIQVKTKRDDDELHHSSAGILFHLKSATKKVVSFHQAPTQHNDSSMQQGCAQSLDVFLKAPSQTILKEIVCV